MRRSFVLLVGVLAGCGDSGGMMMGLMLPALQKGTAQTAMPADYACNGHYVDPAGATADFPLAGVVKDFQTGDPVPNATIRIYPDLAALLSDQPSDTKVSGDDGMYHGLIVPAGHYRVNFKVSAPEQLDTYAVGIPIPPGTTSSSRDSVSRITAMSLPALVGLAYDLSQAIIAGGVRDCTNTFVSGAQVSITASQGAVPDTQVFYFKFDVPVRKTQQQFTNFDGLWTGINIPPSGMAEVTAKGVIQSGGMVQDIGHTQLPLFPGALTIADIPPLAQ